MKHFLFLTFLLLTGVVQAQSKTDSTSADFNLRTSAEKMGQLFVEKNYSQYVKYVHPKVLKIFGGQEKMIDALKKTLSQMEQEGFTFKNVTIGELSKIISNKNELESIVPQILQLKTKDGRIVSTSYLLALSTDKGKTWYFVDTSGKTLEQMKGLFPGLSNELIIPKKTQPLFYKD